MGLGFVAGISLDKSLDPLVFRKLVLWLLVVIPLELATGCVKACSQIFIASKWHPSSASICCLS